MRGWQLALGGIVLVVGITARLYTAQLDSTFDMESYRLVAEIVQRGGNVYAETDRYNYGAPWFIVLGAVGQIAQNTPDPQTAFRMGIALLLTLVDVVLYGIVGRRYGLWAGVLFFLNPISILVTGTHSQFDNLAVLWGILAVLLYGDTPIERLTTRHYGALILLGVSLSIKHVLLVFPLWLAVREPTFRRKLLVLLLPIGIFIAELLPFWHPDILTQVFFYQSFRNTPFIQYGLPRGIYEALRVADSGVWLSSWGLFLGALSLGALACRRWRTLDALLMYTLLLAVFTPAMANQYAAIPVAALAVYANPFFIAYGILMGWHMLADAPNLYVQVGIAGASRDLRDWLVIVLAAGLLWQAYRVPLVAAARRFARWLEVEVTAQLPIFMHQRARVWLGSMALMLALGGGFALLRPTASNAELVRLEGNFGALRLEGYRSYQSDYTPQGTLSLELVWAVQEVPSETLEVVFLFQNTRTLQIDSKQHFALPANLAAGTSFPQRYILRLPNTDLTESYAIFAGVYAPQRDAQIGLQSAIAEINGDTLRVTALQVRAGAPRGQLPALATWADTIALTNYRCLLADGQLRLTLDWQMQQRLSYETRFFVHVFDLENTLLAQVDGRLSDLHPLDGLPLLARLMTDYTFPDMPLEVIVRFGFYRLSDGERLNGVSATLPIEDATVRLGCKL